MKIVPSLVSASTVIAVYLWAMRIRGEGFVVLSAAILLTSTRFTKYANGFMLDPFLAAFSVWAVYLALVARADGRYRADFAFYAGICSGCAFMSKGPFAFAPFGVILVFYALSIRTRGMTRVIPAFLLGSALPVGPWFLLAGGRFYLERYFIEHVSSRLGHYTFREHLEPLRNLAHVYWPWLPFAAIGFWKSLPRKT